MPKILIIAPAWIGDAIMAQPLYRRLHERYPGLVLDVLAPAWTRAVHARMPEVNETLDNPFTHGELNLRARRKLAHQLKARRYDQAIVLPNSLKSALIPWFARIPLRTGWVGEMRYGLLNDARKLDTEALPKMVERFAALAEDRNQLLQRPVPYPRLVIDAAARAAALQKAGLNADQSVIALCPGAEYGPAKRWPAHHAAALARELLAEGKQVWLFGSGKDNEIAGEIAALAPGSVNLSGKTSLAEAIDLLSLASAVVTNDSGLMHVAAALDRPSVAVYGSSSPRFTPPLSDKARIVTLALACSPCFKRTCPLGHMQCLNDLGPERVRIALADLVPELFAR
ncbi:heptosyltransferase-2 [Formivibrio citricus]|uniref:lipopolysaccharide heptosyltransferase II n=1 Tax=Formivibrio citricus TaxID=83765 RepID=A0A1I4VZL3_9NEIS|nr:lipopolysaccharide heptosyltransferase II [Formivibrio citricus]SFN06711.1 heptosyltransferase-2 [Formivibrio citricus]